MDARPQRPVRPLRLPGDENAVPVTKQTLHQRHKSTGALSHMLGVQGLKAAAKRTAFGDVSNTVKNLVHDDPALAGKSTKAEMVKPLAHPHPEKPAALLRPAPRPLCVAPLKSVINSIIPNTAAEPNPIPAPLKAPLAEARPHALQLPAPKRTLSKKSTIIYKDSSAEVDSHGRPATGYDTYQEPASFAPAHQILEPRQRKSQSQLKVVKHITEKSESLHTENAPRGLAGLVSRDPIYEDAREDNVAAVEGFQDYVKLDEIVEREKELAKEVVDRHNRGLPAPPPIPDIEEYWEDEEEEVYDEQGYTTAHSYRSRGDNTTGGATTILFPKVTQKTKKELHDAKEIVERSLTREDYEDEKWDTSMVAEYGDEIFAYMRELEIKMLPNAHYMDNQAEVQWSMRSVLMDWLIQVHHRFSLLPETLFLCVNYIDRFLSCKVVSLGKLQLVGATAIFIAAKYEEINCPSVSEIVYMVDGGYTVDEILKAERFMLSMLQFELGWPGPMSFLRRVSKADEYDFETRTLAKYFLEVTIMDERFVGSPPSYVAAGAHCFARFMLKKGDWSPSHIYYSGYTWQQLRPLVSMMLECCENPQKHHAAVFDKYSDRRYKRASLFVQADLARGFALPMIQLFNSRPSLPSLEDVASNMPYEIRNSLKHMVQLKN